VNKKQIVIMAGVGLICFGLAFTVGLFTRTSKEPVVEGTPGDAEKVEILTTSTGAAAVATSSNSTTPLNTFQAKEVNLGKSLTEKQLISLVFEMHSRLAEFASKEKTLIEKESRVQMSIEELQKNIKEMESLRVKLAATASSIKQQLKNLDEKRIIIGEVEKKNILKAALLYDKMKPAEASEIMITLAGSNQLDFVVKIAYYMSERTSAKLLGEISKTQAILASTISEKLRWIDDTTP
jgi:hypothetical protein